MDWSAVSNWATTTITKRATSSSVTCSRKCRRSCREADESRGLRVTRRASGSGPRSTKGCPVQVSKFNSPSTVKNRLDRVNELIKRELDGLIRKEVQMAAKLVTVKEVELEPDLKHAKGWMGMIGTQEEQHASMASLHAARKELQSALSRRVILKFTPQLHFKLDATGERGDRVLNILKQLNLPPVSRPEKESDPDAN